MNTLLWIVAIYLILVVTTYFILSLIFVYSEGQLMDAVILSLLNVGSLVIYILYHGMKRLTKRKERKLIGEVRHTRGNQERAAEMVGMHLRDNTNFYNIKDMFVFLISRKKGRR